MLKYILLCFCGMISLCAISKACRCFTRHPQTNFCEADYAIKADILKEDVIGQFGGRRYRVKVLKNYKSGYAKLFEFSESKKRGACKVRNEMKLNRTKRNKSNQNETKPKIETKQK
uniref:Metalloproteinase inhibitor 3 n=1 Tax=Magallana gigas TaxID=29159 RepID=K1QPK1_MAGGI